MPIDCTPRPEDGFVEVTWSGTITACDLSRRWSEILPDPEVLRIGRALTDVREADLAFSGAELAEAVRTVAVPALQGRKWRSAIVVRTPLQFGVSRQYEVFAKEFGEAGIFFDLDAARRWLLQEVADPIRGE